MKKFLYCLELESGAKLIAAYCASVNVVFIFALFGIYSHMDVKKMMSAIDEIKALGLAAMINFMIYYIVGSLLIIVGVTERKYKTMLYYLKVHGCMSCGIAIAGPIFNYYFGNAKTMLLLLGDIIFRFYSMACVHSLYEKFKYEQNEREKMEASEKAFASYGTVSADVATTATAHHSAITETHGRKK